MQVENERDANQESAPLRLNQEANQPPRLIKALLQKGVTVVQIQLIQGKSEEKLKYEIYNTQDHFTGQR